MVRNAFDKAVAIAGACLLWQLLAAVSYRGSISGPIEALSALVQTFVQGTIWEPLVETLRVWALGLAVAVLVAIPIGFLLGRLALVYRAVVVIIDFLRSIPAIALIPLVVLLFGTGLPGTVSLVAFAAVWPLLLQTIYGARDVDTVARDTFRSYSIGGGTVLTRLLLPSAAPYIATGLRISAYVSLLITIGVQLIMPAGGIGQAILITQSSGAYPQMYALILLSGILGLAINRLFGLAEAKALHWHISHRGMVTT